MMRRVVILAVLFVLFVSPFSVWARTTQPKVDPRAWATTYEPATLTTADVLAAAKRADGGSAPSTTLRITYDFHDGGLTGVERDVWRGDDYRSDTTVGPFVSADGRYQGQRWELGENGYTLYKRGIHQRAAANTRALESSEPGDEVRLLGRLRTPADVYVVRVAPRDGREERRFYDAATFHMVRRETHYLDTLVVTTYDDYRTVKGTTLPYRTTYSDGHVDNDKQLSIRELTVDGPVKDGELEIPPGRRAPVLFPPGVDHVKLPARIDDWGAVIVRLTINGRGLDLQLDSGCSSIVLDKRVAKELGLPIYGQWTQTVAGTFSAGKTVVPSLQIGTIVMPDVVVDTLPFTYQNDEHTKVVGLLGFDFIAGGVIKIDYEHGTVDAYRYGYEPPKDALILDAVLDDGVPMIPVSVNGAEGERFILDTGAGDVVLFSGFTKLHPAAVTDHSPGKIISRAFNLISSEGVGGELHTQALALERVKIGQVTFGDFLSEVMAGDQPAFEGEDTDGLIGASVLSAFDVYLDYANSRVAFVLNASALKHHPSRGLGSFH